MVGAAVIAAAVLGFQAVSASNGRVTRHGDVTIPASAAASLGLSTNVVQVWTAPSYGRILAAEGLREKFLADVQRSVAVYCLPRTGQSTVRPSAIALTGTYSPTTYDLRRVDTAEAFRLLLANAGLGAGVFSTNPYTDTTTGGAARNQNLSIFVIYPGGGSSLRVGAVYEIDFVRATSPAGTYASVRRYGENAEDTDLYDVFYADMDSAGGTITNTSTNFCVAASFERVGRTENTTIAANRIATSQPFYFVWWPDPSTEQLPTNSGHYTAVMGGQTSFFMVVPMFPPL